VPLYDSNNALGWEVPTLEAVADWLAESTAAQALAEATGSAAEKKAATLEKVVIGPQRGPWNGDNFTISELANQFVDFQLFAPTEGGKTTIVEGFEVSCDGQFILLTHRFCRESEMTDPQDVYKFFLDCISAMEEQLCDWMASREKPRIKGMVRENLSFSSKREATAQGDYIFAIHTIPWGDFTEAET
jgi:hypothetical protein